MGAVEKAIGRPWARRPAAGMQRSRLAHISRPRGHGCLRTRCMPAAWESKMAKVLQVSDWAASPIQTRVAWCRSCSQAHGSRPGITHMVSCPSCRLARTAPPLKMAGGEACDGSMATRAWRGWARQEERAWPSTETGGRGCGARGRR